MNDRDARIAAEVAAAREEYAEEEAEAAEMEIAEKNAALVIPLNLRIDAALDAQLKERARAAGLPTSAIVRRLLREVLEVPATPALTEQQVEEIARRVLTQAR